MSSHKEKKELALKIDNKTKCEHCGRIFKNSGYSIHIRTCLKNIKLKENPPPPPQPKIYTCKHCGKTFDYSRTYTGHMLRCKKNPKYKKNLRIHKKKTKGKVPSKKILANRRKGVIELQRRKKQLGKSGRKTCKFVIIDKEKFTITISDGLNTEV